MANTYAGGRPAIGAKAQLDRCNATAMHLRAKTRQPFSTRRVCVSWTVKCRLKLSKSDLQVVRLQQVEHLHLRIPVICHHYPRHTNKACCDTAPTRSLRAMNAYNHVCRLLANNADSSTTRSRGVEPRSQLVRLPFPMNYQNCLVVSMCISILRVCVPMMQSSALFSLPMSFFS